MVASHRGMIYDCEVLYKATFSRSDIHFSTLFLVDKAEALTKLLPRLLVTKPLRSSPVVPCSLAYTLG